MQTNDNNVNNSTDRKSCRDRSALKRGMQPGLYNASKALSQVEDGEGLRPSLVSWLCPVPIGPFSQAATYRPDRIIPDGTSIPLLARLALSGWGYTDFHAVVNFAFTEFSEVRSGFR